MLNKVSIIFFIIMSVGFIILLIRNIFKNLKYIRSREIVNIFLVKECVLFL